MLIIKAKFESIKQLKTRQNIVFSTTEELNDIQIEQIKKTQGYLAFSADVFKKNVEEAMKNKKIGLREDGLTWSQKLRGTLNVIWQNHHSDQMDFEDFYGAKMAMIDQHFKKFI